jgi:hypothetical protein
MSVAQIIAPVIGGFLIDRELLTTWAVTGAAISFAGVLIGRVRLAGAS